MNRHAWAAVGICFFALYAGASTMVGAILGSWIVCLSSLFLVFQVFLFILARESGLQTGEAYSKLFDNYARIDALYTEALVATRRAKYGCIHPPNCEYCSWCGFDSRESEHADKKD